MKVWLDDERPAPAGWTHVRTVGDVVSLVLAEEPFGGVEAISLDHDLGEADGTGYDVLLWLERELHLGYMARCPRLYVHTANPPARKRMVAAIRAIETFLGGDGNGELRAIQRATPPKGSCGTPPEGET